MSRSQTSTTDDGPPDLSAYQEGPDRYVNFARDILGVRLTEQQRSILQSLAEHKRTIIMSGNGPGKSFGVAIAKVAFLFAHQGSTVLGTSGSYSQYVDAVWRPMKQLYRQVGQQLEAHGVTIPDPNDSGQPTLNLDTNWFAKVVSPRDPGDLEGRHGSHVLVVIEEADKAYIDGDHFDSARSSVTDANDRMLAICNPPRDESNAVYERLESDGWHTLQFSTLDSHNVKVDAGELDADRIPGITDLDTIKADWEAYNSEPWPGLDAARSMSDPDSEDFRDDLDERWYRRRAGVMPPARAVAWRPIQKASVQRAWDREMPDLERAEGTGVDVARSGADDTVAASADDRALPIRYEASGDNYTTQRDQLAVTFDGDDDHPMAVDSIGEGSGLADMLAEQFGGVIRYGNGQEPVQGQTYYSCWEEALDLIGDWLADGGSIDDRDLYEELLVASRSIAFEERHYASRGTEVAKATAKKSDLKKTLGRSPDRLDAAMMAVWARDSGASSAAASATATLGSDPDDDFGTTEIGQAVAEMQRRNRGNRWK